MTLKIERLRSKHGPRILLSGELRSAHIDDVRAEMEGVGAGLTLDLDELTLVDVDAVRFLNACETQGVQVVNCSPYIREWMLQEWLRGEK